MMTKEEKELLVRGILTNSMNNNIYSWKSNPEPDLIDLFLKCARDDPQALSLALTIHKKHGAINNLKYYALAALSVQRNKQNFKKVFPSIILDLDDMLNFTELIRGKEGKKYGFYLNNMSKKLLRVKLGTISEIEILKYNKKKRTDDEIILIDLLKLLHPTFNNPKLNDAIAWVLGQKSQKEFSREDLPISWALYQLTQEVEDEKIRQLVEEFDLNWDMVIARITGNNPHILTSTIFNMHPTEVIHKFHSIIRQGCLKISYTEGVLLAKLKELKSMAYRIEDPFRAYLLWRNLDTSLPEIFFEEIARLLNNVKYYEFKSVSNSSVSVFLDCSESMNIQWSKGDDPDSVYQPTIFERGLVHSLLTVNSLNNTKIELLLFDDEVNKLLWDGDFDSMINKVLSRRFKLHSDISIPLKYLIRNKIKTDLIFIFTDYDYNAETINLWKDYKADVNPNAQLFLIQLAPANDEPLNLPDNYFRIAQWNDRTPKLIANAFNYKEYGKEYGIFQKDI